MNDHINNKEQDEYLVPGYSSGHFIKWLALSLVVVSGLLYMAYNFGSNENQRKINRLSNQLQTYGEVESLESIVSQFQSISRTIKLSNNERARLTELLDQLVLHKTSLEQSESELAKAKAELATIHDNYQSQLATVEASNEQLQQQVSELESAMSYTQGTLKQFSIGVFDSYQLLDNPSSRIALQRILNNGSAQFNVGNALMFFHVGHTLRFRFSQWLCDVTLVKIDEDSEQVEFEYVCEINA